MEIAGKLKHWLRHGLMTLGALALCGGLIRVLNADTPLLDSPLSQYLIAASVAGTFVVASLAVGLALTRRLLPGRLRCDERLLVGAALGVLTFYTAVFLVGVAGLLNRVVVLLVPALLLAAGAPEVLRLARCLRGVRQRVRAPAVRGYPVVWLAGGFTLLYWLGGALTSIGIGYDAGWYHLPIAETYAARGAIEPFREGWTMGTYPQISSVLYAWALVVTRDTALGWTTCAFVELSLVLGAVFAIGPLVRALSPGQGRAHGAWAVVALFPAVYLYAPRLEADYAAGFFSAALLLIALKCWQRLDWRIVVAGALALSGLLLVKYTAISASVLPVLILVVSTCRELWRARRSALRPKLFELLTAWGLGGLVFLVATSSHWLKNWVFYGDPLFPNGFSHDLFTPLTRYHYGTVLETLWRPPPGAQGYWDTASAVFTFSFKPHEYAEHNAGHPVFGTLFTLTLAPLLLMVRRAPRLLLVHLGTLLGVVVWYRLHHQDRYLLALLPSMCAVTAGTLRQLWRAGLVPRILVGVACVVQLSWGLRWALKLFPYDAVKRVAWSGTVEDWRSTQTGRSYTMVRIGRSVTAQDKIFVHDVRFRLGLRSGNVTDSLGYQTGVSLVELGSDQRVYDALKQLGVTHLYAASQTDGRDTLGNELVYRGFVGRYGVKTNESYLRRMPAARPAAEDPRERLAFIDLCGTNATKPGLYRVVDLTSFVHSIGAAPVAVARDAAEAEQLLPRAEFLVMPNSCPSVPRLVSSTTGFELVASSSVAQFYWRKRN